MIKLQKLCKYAAKGKVNKNFCHTPKYNLNVTSITTKLEQQKQNKYELLKPITH